VPGELGAQGLGSQRSLSAPAEGARRGGLEALPGRLARCGREETWLLGNKGPERVSRYARTPPQ